MGPGQGGWEAADEISRGLDQLEEQLNHLIREGAHAGRGPGEIVAELDRLAAELQSPFLRLQELLTPRDLSFRSSLGLEELRRRLLWLYRKVLLERIFFAKLRLERSLRDEVYRKIMETYDEFGELEQRERAISALGEEELSSQLQRERSGLLAGSEQQ